jgi:hypothetical protein
MSEKPKSGDNDLIGRSFSDVCGWLPETAEIPVGSRVIIESSGHHDDWGNKYHRGREAVVLGNYSEGRSWKTHYVSLRLVTPVAEREVYQNRLASRRGYVRVLSVGDGQVTPGVDYALCRKEILDALFAKADTTFEGYSNMPTFIAALYLRQDQKHQNAVFHMVRQNGSINPVRLSGYFYKNVEHAGMSDVAWWPDGFPEWTEYRFSVNWQEIADEFAASFKEQSDYTQRMAA